MKCIHQETDQELYLKILVPYQGDFSEETISESRQIKEQHKTIKLLID